MEKMIPDLTQPFTLEPLLFSRIQVLCQAIAMANRALNDSFPAPVLHTQFLLPPSADFDSKKELSASIVALRNEIKKDVSSTFTSFTLEIRDTIRSELKNVSSY